MMATRTRTDSRRLPIGPDHPLYPMLVTIALVGLIFGPAAKDASAGMPEDKTHPYFPDHIWPYPILAVAVMIILGLLAVVGRPLLEPGQAADPRLLAIPRPEWYFLALFQFVKLGPPLITSILVPGALVVGLLLWPLVDAWLGPKLARGLGWQLWPAPRQNAITSTLWFGILAVIGVLTLWATLWPQLCIPWVFSGPVCGG